MSPTGSVPPSRHDDDPGPVQGPRRLAVPVRFALRLLPRSFRERWGNEVEAVAAERLAAARARGPLARFRAVVGLVLDVIGTSWRLRFRGASRTPRPRTPSPREWIIDMLTHDLRFALRALWQRPLFAAVVLLVLGLGIGANAVVYSAVDAVVLDPFDWPEAHRVVGIGVEYPTLERPMRFFEAISAPEYADVRDQVSGLERLVAFDLGNRQITGGDIPQNLFTAFWWGDVLPVLGLEPVQGRGFTPGDLSGEESVAMISHGVWQARFAGDPAVVGSTIRVDGDPYVLIGVFPAAADVYGSDLWLPMWATPELLPRDRRQFNLIGRMEDDTSLRQLQAQLDAVARRTEQEHGAEFDEYRDWRLEARTWADVTRGELEPAALVLLGAVAFVLIMVCSNVASLLLSRSVERRGEVAVRAALGAGRARIVRQLLVESLVLASLGGALGALLGWGALRVLESQLPAILMPATGTMGLDGGALTYVAVLSLASGLLFGLAPALSASRTDLQATLADDSGTATGGRGRQRVHAAFVTVEVALSMVLLFGAGLMVQSFVNLQAVDLGFETDRLLTMRLTLPPQKYQGEEIPRFFRQLADRVEGIPGVTAAGSAAQFPPNVVFRSQFTRPGDETRTGEGTLPDAFYTIASHDYRHTVGIPLQAGRGFTDRDGPTTPFVAVVNETMARRYFDSDAVGKRFKLGRPDEELPSFEIVGVMADVRNRGPAQETQPEFLVSLRQAAGRFNQFYLMVRTEGDPLAVLPEIRDVVASMDAEQPIYSIASMNQRLEAGFAAERFAMRGLGSFGVMALILAAVGIFGVVARSVSERRREIGVRIALGADRGAVRRLVVRQAMLPVLVGLGLGVGLSGLLGRALSGQLFQVASLEPGVLVGAVAVLFLVALVASSLPARRASSVDPVTAFRSAG